MNRLSMVGLCTALLATGALAEGSPGVSSSTPSGMEAEKIFSEVLVHPLPGTFKPAHVENTDGRYLEESVQPGDTADHWTQMITVSGAQDLVTQSAWGTPKRYAAALVQRYIDRCGSTLRVRDKGTQTIAGHDAYAVLIGCERAQKSGDPYSEENLFVVIKGDKDYYTVQWSKRDAPPGAILSLDAPKWSDRLATLMSTKTCPATADGDAYPSCSAAR